MNKDQLKMIENFGRGTNRGRRFGFAPSRFHRDRRRHALNAVSQWFFQLFKELPGVGRQAFDVATLAFGVQRIECQTGLAASAQSTNR